jgi:hypothetical protein
LLQQSEIFDEKIYQLPSFIESLAYVCNQIEDNLPEGSLITLEKLTILAIDNYPKLLKRYNHQISLSIAHLFISIQLGKSKSHTEFISRVVYQSIMKIFSYRTNYFNMNSEDINQKLIKEYTDNNDNNNDSVTQAQVKSPYNITSNDYVMFWSNILNLNDFKESYLVGVHIDDRKKLIGIIYDEYVETIMKIMGKLDLSSTKTDYLDEKQQSSPSNPINSISENDISSNPIAGLRPNKPRDFEIFVNLVDFSRLFLLSCCIFLYFLNSITF